MQVDISYFTFHGSSGNTRMAIDSLPTWLAGRPGTHIIGITPVGNLQDSETFRVAQQRALKIFAEGILRST